MENKTLIYALTVDFYKRLFNDGLISKEELNAINDDLKLKYEPLFDVLLLDLKGV